MGTSEAKDYAFLLYRLIADGDDILESFERRARADGFIDENGEWIYEEDE